ncbi:DUF192 domain-containing protein [Neobacillus drentensis]|uniref:DUF192 domain-containing protein n=1 Tax=Neobacillus drentensis TaxID=220684 RepID=UPI00083725F8|nr:DUF192 domain-containing protein [Neobacillus drentensis]
MVENVISIPYQIKLADSFFIRLKGLMFRKDPIKDEGLWIVPCNAIHMFFMKFPLDIVLLNKQNEVIKVYHSLKPWRMTKPVKAAYSTLELPAGTINQLGIYVGCIINMQV